jgi:hypothetical protein
VSESYGFFRDPELGEERRGRAKALKEGDQEAGVALRKELNEWHRAIRARREAETES